MNEFVATRKTQLRFDVGRALAPQSFGVAA
jgi:hypothetical protein